MTDTPMSAAPVPGPAGPSPAVPSTVSGGAQIFDRGYRRYAGERTGMAGAVRTRQPVHLSCPARSGPHAMAKPFLTIGRCFRNLKLVHAVPGWAHDCQISRFFLRSTACEPPVPSSPWSPFSSC